MSGFELVNADLDPTGKDIIKVQNYSIAHLLHQQQIIHFREWAYKREN